MDKRAVSPRIAVDGAVHLALYQGAACRMQQDGDGVC